MLHIDAKITGASDVRRKLQDVQKGVGAVISQKTMGDFLLMRIRKRYLAEKDPDGNRWRALSANTRPGPQILIQKGNLFRAINYVGSSSDGSFGSATGAGFRIGVRSQKIRVQTKNGSRVVDPAEYGRVHQFGTGKVPQRRFLGVGEADNDALRAKLRRELRKLVGG